jgi:acetyltransferase-like isoleucine patch superfamily enzyme
MSAGRRATVVIAEGVGHVLVTPLVVALALHLVAFSSVSNALSIVPGRPGWIMRRAWYERTLAACGKGLVVDFGAAIRVQRSTIGDNCYIGLWNWFGWVEIGDDFLSGSHTVLLSGRHQHHFARLDIPMRLQGGEHTPLRIGDDVWVGAHAVVAADVAAHSIVASSASVTRTFDEFDILGGVPARQIGNRRQQTGADAGRPMPA